MIDGGESFNFESYEITHRDFKIHICATSRVLLGIIAFVNLQVNFPVSCT